MLVGLDPGHGGTNIGCEGNGLHEEVLTLQTAQVLREHLTAKTGHRVMLTREDSETVTFTQRAARLAACDFVMSLHYDTSPQASTGHMASYCFAGDDVSQIAGHCILENAPPALRPGRPSLVFVNQQDWTVRAYNVLIHHRPKPALLVEVGFLSNPGHVALFTQPGGLALVAVALAAGVGKAAQLIGLDAPHPPVSA